MNSALLEALKQWRMEQAMLEDIPLYYVFSNATLESIASAPTMNADILQNIPGIGDKKFEKYGQMILSLCEKVGGEASASSLFDDVNYSKHSLNTSMALNVSTALNIQDHDSEYGHKHEHGGGQSTKSNMKNSSIVLTVAECVVQFNMHLRSMGALRIRGEIFQWKIAAGGYVYFTLKDSSGKDAQIQGMIFPNVILNLEDFFEGVEVEIVGFADVYPKSGKLSVRVQSMSLAGEGMWKKAYDALKAELTKQGYFDSSRKPVVPEFIYSIGLITSLHGVVYEDFRNNLGKRGYRIECIDTRVEGVDAIRDVVSAIEAFEQRPVDVIVILRGGGSLESMSAFNSKEVADAIFHSQKPVICGIGHDTDVPIACLVASANYSTPSIVAKEIDAPHMLRATRFEGVSDRLFTSFARLLREGNTRLEHSERSVYFAISKCESGLRRKRFILSTFMRIAREYLKGAITIQNNFLLRVEQFQKVLKYLKDSHASAQDGIIRAFSQSIQATQNRLAILGNQLESHNPSRLLRLGYSILQTEDGKIITSTTNVVPGEVIVNMLADGVVRSTVVDSGGEG